MELLEVYRELRDGDGHGRFKTLWILLHLYLFGIYGEN